MSQDSTNITRRSAMTLRVSRDSGKTYGPVTIVPSDPQSPLPVNIAEPRCTCQRCEDTR